MLDWKLFMHIICYIHHLRRISKLDPDVLLLGFLVKVYESVSIAEYRANEGR